jgi:hypothetical protein
MYTELIEWRVFDRATQCTVSEGFADTVEAAKVLATEALDKYGHSRVYATVEHTKHSGEGDTQQWLNDDLYTLESGEEWIKE